MTKQELIDLTRDIVKQIYNPTETRVDLDTTTTGVSLDIESFPLIAKFPLLKKVIESLLTIQYDLFIQDILWIAPRPTTFKVLLKNDQSFYLIFTEKSWIAKIEGKKYYLSTFNDTERATEAIARILSYGNIASATAGEAPAPAEETPAEEAPAEETPTEETPET